MFKSLMFVLRIALAWTALFVVGSLFWSATPGYHDGKLATLLYFVTLAFVLVGAFSHLGRVRLIAGEVDSSALANRQRRQIEIPFEAGEAFVRDHEQRRAEHVQRNGHSDVFERVGAVVSLEAGFAGGGYREAVDAAIVLHDRAGLDAVDLPLGELHHRGRFLVLG